MSERFDFALEVYRLAKRTGIQYPESISFDSTIVADPVIAMRIEYREFLGVGYAIRLRSDKFDRNRGLRIALARAMRDVAAKEREAYPNSIFKVQ